jgi:hypothetical protein
MESSPEPWATTQTAAVRDEQQPDRCSARGLLLGVELAGVASKLESRPRWKLFPDLFPKRRCEHVACVPKPRNPLSAGISSVGGDTTSTCDPAAGARPSFRARKDEKM